MNRWSTAPWLVHRRQGQLPAWEDEVRVDDLRVRVRDDPDEVSVDVPIVPFADVPERVAWLYYVGRAIRSVDSGHRRVATDHAESLELSPKTPSRRLDARDMIHDVPAIVAHLSRGMRLLPGDLVFTGTAAGVGAGHTPPSSLHDGDVVEITSPQLGTLRNTFADVVTPAPPVPEGPGSGAAGGPR